MTHQLILPEVELITKDDAVRLIETNVKQCVACGWLPDFVGKVIDPVTDKTVQELNKKLQDLFKDVDKAFIRASLKSSST